MHAKSKHANLVGHNCTYLDKNTKMKVRKKNSIRSIWSYFINLIIWKKLSGFCTSEPSTSYVLIKKTCTWGFFMPQSKIPILLF